MDSSDINADIDALFVHLVDELDHDLDEELDWMFSFRSRDLSKLEHVAEQLREEFETTLQEEVEESADDGETALGEPLLSVVRRGALTAGDVKALVAQMAQLAEKEGIEFEGVECHGVMDDDEAFEWLQAEEASLRLRHFSDMGMPPDAELPWAFLLLTNHQRRLQEAADAFQAAGFDRVDIYDEPDEFGVYGLCVFVDGRNNEAELQATYQSVEQIAEQHDAHLEGMQFCSEEELYAEDNFEEGAFGESDDEDEFDEDEFDDDDDDDSEE